MVHVANPVLLIVAFIILGCVGYLIAWLLSFVFYGLRKLPGMNKCPQLLTSFVHAVVLLMCEILWFSAWGLISYPIVMGSPIF